MDAGEPSTYAEPRQLARTQVPWEMVAVCLLAIVSFAPTLGFQFVNWDDDIHLYRNPLVLAPGTAPLSEHLLTPALGYPIPITILTYQIETHLAGLSPWLFHLTNVLVHLASTLLLFRLGRALGLARTGATTAAALFALHPIASEPVAWVTGRKDLLAVAFSLAGTLAFLRAHRSAKETSARTVDAPLALLFLILAILSKPIALCLPLAWAALLHVRLRASLTATLRAVAPGLAIAILLCLFSLIGLRANGAGIHHESFAALAREIWYALGYHVGLVFLARPPIAKFIPPTMPPPFDPTIDLLPLLLPLAIWLSHRALVHARSRASRRRIALFGLCWAGAAYLPNAGLFPIPRFVATSYVYATLPGFGLAFGAIVDAALARACLTFDLRMLARGLAAALALAFAGLTVRAAAPWHDGVSLWGSVYAQYPDSPQVCRAYGNAAFAAQRLETALTTYRACAERLGPDTFDKNIGITLITLGRRAEAAPVLARAAAHHPDDPTVARYLELARTTGSR